jgi:carbamoyl-phosphate synthase large subunit
VLLSTGPLESKVAFLESAHRLRSLGVEFFATQGTADFMRQGGLEPDVLRWPLDGGSPNALDYIREKRVDLVINIPKDFGKEELTNDYMIRRAAVDYGIPLITNLQLAQRLAESLSRVPVESLGVQRWTEYGR